MINRNSNGKEWKHFVVKGYKFIFNPFKMGYLSSVIIS